MAYALVISNAIQAVRSPGRVETKLSDGRPLSPPDTGWTDTLAALCGFLPIVETARPADTATHTSDATVTLVAGVPTRQWTVRPKTQAELDAAAQQANASTIDTNLLNDLTAMQAVLDRAAVPFTQQGVRDVQRDVQDCARALRRIIRRQLGRFDGAS